MSKQLKISEIRDIIRAARWLRNDFAGHTREEFKRAPVAARMQEKIDELQTLLVIIPARFVDDVERCREEIEYCGKVRDRANAQ